MLIVSDCLIFSQKKNGAYEPEDGEEMVLLLFRKHESELEPDVLSRALAILGIADLSDA